jgi:hypothetical protein
VGAVSFGGLITLVVIAAVVLLFTARYPKPIYDFVPNRWVFRVAAYALLITKARAPRRTGRAPFDSARPGLSRASLRMRLGGVCTSAAEFPSVRGLRRAQSDRCDANDALRV